MLAKLKSWYRKERESPPVEVRQAAVPPPIEPPPEVQQEIRLALVLNGGVSLAVWMGGVTHEIDELRRSSWQFPVEGLPSFSAAHAIYTGLLAALRTGLRVDIIAGSSAGGINGAALAAAIAVRRPLRVEGKPLRDLWIDVGDMTNLLRSAGERNPPSLLKGDTFMLPQMRKAFASILGDGPAPLQTFSASANAEELQAALAAERADASAVRLFVTTTAFRPNSRPFTDALGTAFNVLDNRLRFRFIRDPWLNRDNFASTGSDMTPAQLMALAARATASFPV
ncbi:MAG: patatin-like phospholipase family protein, partial [Actinomycetota bacterium]|nr:patatin-like phospholipase family protein [Actinomycetota bacterium]